MQIPLFGGIGEAFNWTETANLRTRLEVSGLHDLDDGLSLDLRPHMLVMHDAARAYAEGIVDMAFADDNAVAQDPELQAFVWDLCSEDGGNIQGLCWGGNSEGRERNSAETPMPTKGALSGLLGDAVSGIFLIHAFVHSRAAHKLLFIPFGSTNMRPNFLPNPESVCTEQDFLDSFGDYEDWRRHTIFLLQVFNPVMGHLSLFRGHYSTAVGGGGGTDDPLFAEKNALFDTFVDTIEGSLKSHDADSGLDAWQQLSAWISI